MSLDFTAKVLFDSHYAISVAVYAKEDEAKAFFCLRYGALICVASAAIALVSALFGATSSAAVGCAILFSPCLVIFHLICDKLSERETAYTVTRFFVKLFS